MPALHSPFRVYSLMEAMLVGSAHCSRRSTNREATFADSQSASGVRLQLARLRAVSFHRLAVRLGSLHLAHTRHQQSQWALRVHRARCFVYGFVRLCEWDRGRGTTTVTVSTCACAFVPLSEPGRDGTADCFEINSDNLWPSFFFH